MRRVRSAASAGRRSASATAPALRAAACLFVLVAALVVLPAGPAQAQPLIPTAELRVVGSVEERPPGDGATTGSEMRYRIKIENRGPDPIPVDGLSLVIFVDRGDSTQMATIEVSRFSSGGLKNIPGSACGRGTHRVIRCTNRQVLEADGEINLDIAHRHPAAIAGQLSFFAEVSPRDEAFVDSGGVNNFRGPSYVFRNQPTTTTTAPTTTVPATTTTEPPSTTSSSSPSTTEPGSTTTSSSTSESSTTTTEATTTTSSSTTTTMPSTTTTEASTTTTAATTTSSTSTTALVTTSSIELRNGSDATLVTPGSGADPGSGDQSGGDLGDSDVAVALGPQAEDDGGPPYLLFGGLFAGLLLLGGLTLGAYVYYNRDPPLVDIRQFQ